jgi:hypothetical protein
MKFTRLPGHFLHRKESEVDALLIATDFTIQIWLVEQMPTCIYLRKIPEICLFDVLQPGHVGYVSFESKN